MTLLISPPDANNKTIVDAFTYANSVTNDLLGIGLLVTIFAIFFISFINHGPERSFSYASIITFISSVFFWIMGIATPYAMIVTALMTAVSIFFLRGNGS